MSIKNWSEKNWVTVILFLLMSALLIWGLILTGEALSLIVAIGFFVTAIAAGVRISIGFDNWDRDKKE